VPGPLFHRSGFLSPLQCVSQTHLWQATCILGVLIATRLPPFIITIA
jgi:hypothetical protein